MNNEKILDLYLERKQINAIVEDIKKISPKCWKALPFQNAYDEAKEDIILMLKRYE
jgi:hypothetical protein